LIRTPSVLGPNSVFLGLEFGLELCALGRKDAPGLLGCFDVPFDFGGAYVVCERNLTLGNLGRVDRIEFGEFRLLGVRELLDRRVSIEPLHGQFVS